MQQTVFRLAVVAGCLLAVYTAPTTRKTTTVTASTTKSTKMKTTTTTTMAPTTEARTRQKMTTQRPSTMRTVTARKTSPHSLRSLVTNHTTSAPIPEPANETSDLLPIDMQWKEDATDTPGLSRSAAAEVKAFLNASTAGALEKETLITLILRTVSQALKEEGSLQPYFGPVLVTILNRLRAEPSHLAVLDVHSSVLMVAVIASLQKVDGTLPYGAGDFLVVLTNLAANGTVTPELLQTIPALIQRIRNGLVIPPFQKSLQLLSSLQQQIASNSKDDATMQSTFYEVINILRMDKTALEVAVAAGDIRRNLSDVVGLMLGYLSVVKATLPATIGPLLVEMYHVLKDASTNANSFSLPVAFSDKLTAYLLSLMTNGASTPTSRPAVVAGALVVPSTSTSSSFNFDLLFLATILFVATEATT